MIVVIDNYDSFTYNLVQLVEELGQKCIVKRNDKVTVKEIEKMKPDYIIVSPGPGVPENAGITMELIKTLGKKIPVLGVCLGHQAIAKSFGGDIKLAKQLMHGKSSTIYHNNSSLFTNVPEQFKAGRYHSWIIDKDNLPLEIEITAVTEDDEVMAVKHKFYPIEGVQFHPESILTPDGKQLILNFLNKYQPFDMGKVVI